MENKNKEHVNLHDTYIKEWKNREDLLEDFIDRLNNDFDKNKHDFNRVKNIKNMLKSVGKTELKIETLDTELGEFVHIKTINFTGYWLYLEHEIDNPYKIITSEQLAKENIDDIVMQQLDIDNTTVFRFSINNTIYFATPKVVLIK